ncbi:MAG: hypothetical protein QOH06_2492 [Acidobacteriota bacterium]|jgi:heme exporter protein D|nr:hypothetical protein [Acidobacteriota bacterium]
MSEPLRHPRRYLGRAQTLSERVRTYWTDEALEVDRADNYEIRRRRVFFDEILLVTLHSTRGVLVSILPLFLALFFVIMALALRDEPDASRVFWLLAAFFVASAVGAALAPVWVVTVYGKRTRARMHFRMRQRKAREVYAEIAQAAADAQRALALRLAAEIPKPPLPPIPPEVPPLPLSDSDPPSL